MTIDIVFFITLAVAVIVVMSVADDIKNINKNDEKRQ